MDTFLQAAIEEAKSGLAEGGIPIGSVLVIGENRTFRGPEEYLRSRGVEVILADDPECRQLMQAFIAENPEPWNEDIGE